MHTEAEDGKVWIYFTDVAHDAIARRLRGWEEPIADLLPMLDHWAFAPRDMAPRAGLGATTADAT